MLAIATTLAVCALAIGFAAVRSGSRATARGCVTVDIASTTGGAMMHVCGTKAARLCRGEITIGSRLTDSLRQRCQQAGLR
jgi:hypothetical protein